jgi:BMFP domain-containing protein YqiC
MQVNNRLLDDLARLMSGAVGAAAGMKGEVETLLRERLRRVLDDADLVSREEFEAVKAMAATARAEQEALAAKVAALEARLAAAGNGPTDPTFQR